MNFNKKLIISELRRAIVITIYVFAAISVLLITLTSWAYVTYKEQTNLFPYTLKHTVFESNNGEKPGYISYSSGYPDYKNSKGESFSDIFIFNEETYRIFSFVYPEDLELKEFPSYVTLKPAAGTPLYNPRDNENWYIIEKREYIENYGSNFQKRGSTNINNIVSGEFVGVHEYSQEYEKIVLNLKDNTQNTYILYSTKRGPITDKIFKDISETFKVSEVQIYVPRMYYVYNTFSEIFKLFGI